MSFPTNTSPYGMPNRFQNLGQTPSQPSGQPSGNSFFQALFGKPERNYQQSLLSQEQQPNLSSLLQALKGRGAEGAFGQSADYYRDLLDPNSQTFSAMSDPEMRRFREQIVPDLAEQFSGHGGIGSSGFRNAALGAGADLSERLGAIRASLRQQAAQGLTGLGQLGLGQYQENIHRPETFGLLGSAFEGAGKAAGAVAGRAALGGM
jgi:hypothetical protein